MLYVLLRELYKVKSNYKIVVPISVIPTIPYELYDNIIFIKNSIPYFLKEIFESEIFIMGGGTQLFDKGKIKDRFFSLFMILLMIIYAKVTSKIYLIGIGVEKPDTFWGKFFINNILRMSDKISLRDLNSYNYVKNYNPKCIYSFELGINFLIYKEFNKIVKKLFKSNTLGISILPYDEIFNINIDDYYKKVIKYINNCSFMYNKILLMGLKGSGKYSDEKIINMIYSKINNKNNVSIVLYKNNIYDFINKIKTCDVILAMRYHSIVLAYILNTKATVINYMGKNKFLSDELGYKLVNVKNNDSVEKMIQYSKIASLPYFLSLKKLKKNFENL